MWYKVGTGRKHRIGQIYIFLHNNARFCRTLFLKVLKSTAFAWLWILGTLICDKQCLFFALKQSQHKSQNKIVFRISIHYTPTLHVEIPIKRYAAFPKRYAPFVQKLRCFSQKGRLLSTERYVTFGLEDLRIQPLRVLWVLNFREKPFQLWVAV